MKPPSRPKTSQLDLFNARFEQLLNHQHPLYVLAGKLDWNRFDLAFEDCYCPDTGAPAKAIRLMVGLHYLKHAFNESDESLLERWVENPYWQYFCGYETMQHDVPLHSTSLTKWRQRVGAEKLAELIQETISLALSEQQITQRELAQVIVDTTVQEKNIAYRGHGYEGEATVHLAGSSLRGLSRTQQKRRQRRSAVEPKIGHMKSDHRMRRCFLKGLIGDAINAVLAAAGSNLLKLLRAYAHALILRLWSRISGGIQQLARPQGAVLAM